MYEWLWSGNNKRELLGGAADVKSTLRMIINVTFGPGGCKKIKIVLTAVLSQLSRMWTRTVEIKGLAGYNNLKKIYLK